MLEHGCWDEKKVNPDVDAGNHKFAKVDNAEKYTAGWKSAFSTHNDNAKESPVVASVKVQMSPVGKLFSPINTPDSLGYVLKYYPGEGMAVTAPTNSQGHFAAGMAYSLGEWSVNYRFAEQFLKIAPRCKN